MNHPNEHTKSDRLYVIDSLRGFALAGILLLHSIEHFMYFVYPNPSCEALQRLNSGVSDATYFLFSNKSYAIFALLFGFTLYVQQSHHQRKGEHFALRFVWRMVLLFLFSMVNSAFFAADMLTGFAIAGVLVLPLRRASVRTLLICAGVLFLQPLELLHCIGAIDLPRLYHNEILLRGISIITSGDFTGMAIEQLTTGKLNNLAWVFDNGRASQIPGLILLGVALGKGEFFRRGADFWIKVLLVSAGSAFIFYCAAASVVPDSTPLFKMWNGLCFTGVLVSIYILLSKHDYFVRLTQPLACYGRMSLTNYIAQPIVATWILYPYGLGLAQHLGTTASLVLGFGLLAGQIAMSRYYLAHHKRGPLEELWYRLTWIKLSRR